jgi:hypothetical protein
MSFTFQVQVSRGIVYIVPVGKKPKHSILLHFKYYNNLGLRL